MAFCYTNKRGVIYFLHARTTTRKGRTNTLFFFSKEQKDGAIDAVPQGYRVDETPSGLPVLKKA